MESPITKPESRTDARCAVAEQTDLSKKKKRSARNYPAVLTDQVEGYP